MEYGEDVILTKDNAKEILTHMLTSDTVFTNAQCLFVEYHDCIKSPYFILLTVLSQNKKIRDLIDISPIDGLNTEQLFEWYINRKNRNFLLDLATMSEDQVPYDVLLEVLMNNEIFFKTNSELNTVDLIHTAIRTKTAKQIIIFNDMHYDQNGVALEVTKNTNKFISDDVTRIFGKTSGVKFVSGDFRKVVKSLPVDTSYILSDFNKITILEEEKHLTYASLILPIDFAYNYVFDDNGIRTTKPIINFDYLAMHNMFKLNFYNGTYRKA